MRYRVHPPSRRPAGREGTLRAAGPPALSHAAALVVVAAASYGLVGGDLTLALMQVGLGLWAAAWVVGLRPGTARIKR